MRHLLKAKPIECKPENQPTTGVMHWQPLIDAKNAVEAFTVLKKYTPEFERLSVLEQEHKIKPKIDCSLPALFSEYYALTGLLVFEVLDSAILPELRKMNCLELDEQE